MLFSLKFQRNNQKNALAIGFAKGKTGEKGCIFTTLWDETTAYYDRAIFYRSRQCIRLFHPQNMLKIRPFPPAFSVGLQRHIIGHSFGISRNKSVTVSSGAAFSRHMDGHSERPLYRSKRREIVSVHFCLLYVVCCHYEGGKIDTDIIKKALSWYVVVSSPQHGEHTAFFSNFPFGGLHS